MEIFIISFLTFIIGAIVGEPLLKKLANNTEERALYNKLYNMMPELIQEIKDDIINHPHIREFITFCNKTCIYNAKGEMKVYYVEDYNLKGKMEVLENYGLIENNTYNDINRYRLNDKFVKMLLNN